MEEQELYLDPYLTLNKLAKEVAIPPSSLSEIINTNYNKKEN